jgi:hypothetical protein
MARKLDAISSEGLTDDQRRGLFLHHLEKYERALAAKKLKDADMRNVCKLAKVEIGPIAVTQIKLAIALRDEGGADDLKGKLVGMNDIARWMNARIEWQLELFDKDPMSAAERAREDGKNAGLRGLPGKPGPEVNALHSNIWLEGYHEGQKILAAGFRAPLVLSGEGKGKSKRSKANGEVKAAAKAGKSAKTAQAGKTRGKGRTKKIRDDRADERADLH